MAVTISRYNHTTTMLVNKDVEYSTLKAMLLSGAATFTAANTTLAQVTNSGANEVSGNGWAVGGQTLANVTVSVVDTNGAMIDADDIDVEAVAGAIGPATALVIYDDSDANKAPLWYVDFDGSQTAGEGTPFKITFSASGISRITSA
jgi:roadblock/LC7 domain-containing protein